MEKIPTTPEEFLQAMQDVMPKITPTKTGYEIRTKILDMAQTQAVNDYHIQIQAFENGLQLQGEKDEDGNFVQTLTVPSAEQVLKIANTFLEFVNKK